MTRTRALRIALSATAAAALLGCAAIDPWGVRRDLEETQKRYTRMLRWGELERASQFVDPEMREAFLDEIDEYTDVRFSDYEIINVDVTDNNTKAQIAVTYRVYLINQLIERPFRETQEWYRDPETRSWRVRPDLENLRDGLAKLSQ